MGIDWQTLTSLLLNGLSYAALLFFLASGLTIVFGLMKIANLAHGAIYLFGGLTGLAIMQVSGNFFLSILGGAVASGVFGVLLEVGLLRRVRGFELREVLLTLGIALIVSDLASYFWGTRSMIADRPSWLSGQLNIGPFPYSKYHLFVVVVAVGIGLLLHFVYKKTRVGALVRAGVDNREMIQALGVNINRVFTMTFLVGAVLAGIGGVLGGGILGLVPGEEMQILLYALAVIIIGGLGSLPGAALGSILIGILSTFGRVYLPELSYFVIFAPMALILMLNPRGLLGRAS